MKITETGSTYRSNFLKAAFSFSGSMYMACVDPTSESVSTVRTMSSGDFFSMSCSGTISTAD